MNDNMSVQIRRTKNALRVETGAVLLTFASRERLYLQSLTDGAREWMRRSGGTAALETLWVIQFRGPDGTSPEFESGQGRYEGASIADESPEGALLQFEWTVRLAPNAECRVRAGVRVERGSAQTRWSLTVAAPEGWLPARVEFPLFRNLKPGRRARFLAPTGWGVEHDFAPGFDFDARYPSWQAVMPFMAVLAADRGLYVGAHDARGFLKNLRARGGKGGGALSLVHWPPLAPESAAYSLPYEVVVAPFAGGYWEAAQLYRPFTYQTPWGGAGRIDERPIPDWLKRVQLWLRPDGSPDQNLAVTKAALEHFSVPTALHWYRWHQIPYDTLYPEYFPPLEGFAEAVRELQALGAPVTPYINGRLWDPASRSWAEREAAATAARQPDGACYTEVYGSLAPNNVMCPATPLWREVVAGLVERLTREIGVQGVYIDQIAAAKGELCHNAAHPHAPGGGDYWHTAYRALVQEARRRMPEGTILTTEECAECWLDLFDMHLVLNTPPGEGRLVPLFPAVYSDRALIVGCLYYGREEPRAWLPFRVKNALALLWGSTPGWIQPARIMAPGVRREAEFLRTLARAHGVARRFVEGGRFLGEARVTWDGAGVRREFQLSSGAIDAETASPESGKSHLPPEAVLRAKVRPAFGAPYMMREAAVQATTWLSPKNELGVIAVNISDKEHCVTIHPPVERAGWAVAAPHRAEIIAPDGSRAPLDASAPSSPAPSFPLTIPARAALVIGIHPAHNR